MYNVTDNYKALIAAPVRYTGIRGTIRLKTGEIVRITDSNVVSNSLSIIKKMNGRGDFRPGGVYSSELSIGLKGFSAKTSDLDGAIIGLNFLLYNDSTMQNSETVPLGRFYADGSTIKRKNDTVTLKANDSLMQFDIHATARSGTLFELVSTACSAANVPLGMTQEEFEALPNGTMSAQVNTARIQTERDLLMYIGMATASFARAKREGGQLEFVPLTCEINESNSIVPVRQIKGNVRYSTNFSDDEIRIMKLFYIRNGEKIYSTKKYTDHIDTHKAAQVELIENPLLESVGADGVQTALNNILSNMVKCLNRAFDADFNGDPALDIGDYIRCSGGEIDTSRGYIKSMITSMVWRYRGRHTIKCVLPSSLSAAETAAAAALSTDGASEQAAEQPERVQPKSQTQKQLDYLSGVVGGECGGVGRSAAYDKTSEYFNDYTNNVAGVKGRQSYATARGERTSALAEASTSEGCGGSIDAKSFAAHAEGYNGVITSSQYAHVEGQSSTVTNCDGAHAEGYQNTITGGIGNHAEGGGNINSGTHSHVEGRSCKVTNGASGAHAEGAGTTASADGAHSEGMNTTAGGEGTHAEGNGAVASGAAAHAEGMNTTASGAAAHAEGMNSTASGAFSHAGGMSCTAAGAGSFAGGSSSEARQYGDFAFGESAVTDSDSKNSCTAAFGRYNDPTGHIFSVGNGSADARSNAFSVDADGTIHCTKIEGAEVGGKVDITASEAESTAMLTVEKNEDTGAVTLSAEVNISRDAGNSLCIGGDGGLYADPRARVQYYYTDEITFREGGFDIAYHLAGVSYKSTFAVTEDDSGRITAITEKFEGYMGRSIKINYE